MHSRVMMITRFGDDTNQPKVRESVVRFSRRWATVTTPERVLRRVAGTRRWSHGGGLFVDDGDGQQYVLQSVWPISEEPELWVVDPDPAAEGGFFWAAPRIETDADAAIRIESLERAERHRQARERIRPRGTGEERVQLRLFVEYTVDWPLWGDEGPLEPWELGLSEGLTARLGAWQKLWETKFDLDDGWSTDDDRKQFEREGPALNAALADEVRAFADVERFRG